MPPGLDGLKVHDSSPYRGTTSRLTCSPVTGRPNLARCASAVNATAGATTSTTTIRFRCDAALLAGALLDPDTGERPKHRALTDRFEPACGPGVWSHRFRPNVGQRLCPPLRPAIGGRGETSRAPDRPTQAYTGLHRLLTDLGRTSNVRARMRRRVGFSAGVLPLMVALIATACPRLALCVGGGGHVAIEAIGSDCCSLPGPGDHVGPGDGECASHCTDSPLGVWTTGAARADSRPACVSTPAALLQAALRPLSGISQAALHRCSASPPLPPPRRLRSTVILC